MRRFLRDNGLSVALFGLFLVSIIGQALTGWKAHAEDLRSHGQPSVAFLDYLTTGHFLSATFENWESEFFQMAVYALLTVFLFQKGSSESKKPEEPNAEDQPPEDRRDDPEAPWPVRRGGALSKNLLAFPQPRPYLDVPILILGPLGWEHEALER